MSNRVFRSVLMGVSLCLTLLASAAPGTVVPGRALADVTALVAIGPRVAGTNGSALARQYIRKELLETGYEVETHPVIYNRMRIGVDRDSFLRVGGRVVPGVSPAMSKDARVVAPLVVVKAPEWRESYDLAGIKGAIALVERGRRQDWEVVSYAQEAGARGVVLVNNLGLGPRARPERLQARLAGRAHLRCPDNHHPGAGPHGGRWAAPP